MPISFSTCRSSLQSSLFPISITIAWRRVYWGGEGGGGGGRENAWFSVGLVSLAYYMNSLLKGNWHANIFFLLLPFFSRSRCLSTQEKISKLQTKYFWSYKQLKLHCLEYFLLRVWLVVMSQWEPTGRFFLTTIQMYVRRCSILTPPKFAQTKLYLLVIVMF